MWEVSYIFFRRFCLESFYIFSPFSVQSYPRLVSFLDMNSTRFICVNNSKICDLHGAIFYTNSFGNTAFKRANKPLWSVIKRLERANKALGRANKPLKRAKKSHRRSQQSLRRSNQSLRRSKQLKPDEADVIRHLGSIKRNLVNLKLTVALRGHA